MYGWIIVSGIHRLKRALEECPDPRRRQRLFHLLELKYAELEQSGRNPRRDL